MYESFYDAIRENDINKINQYLIEIKDIDWNKILKCVVINNRLDILKLLHLNKCGDIKYNKGVLLDYAVKYGYLDMIEYLVIECGLKPYQYKLLKTYLMLGFKANDFYSKKYSFELLLPLINI